MTTYYQSSTQNHMVLPHNGGILLASDNILSKNQDLREENRIRVLVNDSLARAAAALKSFKSI